MKIDNAGSYSDIHKISVPELKINLFIQTKTFEFDRNGSFVTIFFLKLFF
jgi:hypothetical protein